MLDIEWIRSKLISGEEYFSQHAEQERQVDDVSCEQCEYCGEQYFEEEFHRIYIHGKIPKQELRVPIEKFHDFQYA
jgi:hypothetical protein